MSAQKAGELLHIFYFLSICEGIINSFVKKKKKESSSGTERKCITRKVCQPSMNLAVDF